MKGNGSLDSNTYLTAAVANTLYLPIGSTTTAIAEGTRLYFLTARVLATTLAGFVATSGTVTAADTILSSIEKIWYNIINGGGGGGGGYVPYIGATQDLDLGTFGLIGDFVQFNTTNSAIPVGAGTMAFNNIDGTADIRLKGGNVNLPIGQQEVVRVVNVTGASLLGADYQAVYISGAVGQILQVDLALAVTGVTSAGTLGLVSETIADTLEGFITSSGLVREIDTTGDLQGEIWADGDILYLSPTVAGQITNVQPIAPDLTVIIGFVVYADAIDGKIFVKVNGGISGAGDINYIPKFDSANSIINSLIYDDGTDIGIATISPTFPADRSGLVIRANGVNSSEILLQSSINTDATIQGLAIANIFDEGGAIYQRANQHLRFGTNNLERMRLTEGGYLAIGLTAPSSIIHAKDSTAYGKIIIDNNGLTGGGSFSASQNGTETAIFGVSGSWATNTTSDAAVVATRASQGIKFYTNGSTTAKGGIDSVGDSFIGQLPAYYAGVTNFIVQGIAAGSLIGITHFDGSIKGIFSTLNSGVNIGSDTPHPVIFRADDIESARIASDGKWLFGTNVNDNVNIVQVNGSIIATSLKKSGGIATEFLKADGSVDSNTYYLASNPSNFITLTAISTTASGLTYNNTTGVISLTVGYVIPLSSSATNWDTAYNSRIASLTTTGDSGNATFISNVLNIPTITLSGIGGQPVATNLTSLSTLNYVSTSFVKMTGSGAFSLDTNTYYLASNPSSFIPLTALSSTALGLTYSNTTGVFSLTAGYMIPTSVQAAQWNTAYTNTISSATGPLSIASNVISIALATASISGYLSASDFNTFNNKENLLIFSTPLVRSTNTISINQASGSVNGYLSSADWSTFNNKQATISLTTTGTSGAATFSANTLNIPNYGSGLSGFVPYTGATGAVNLGAYDLTVNTISVGLGGGAIATNTRVGVSALQGNSTGNSNTAIGHLSLGQTTITGTFNTGVGINSVRYVSSGSFNTGIGGNALINLSTSSNNTAVGVNALQGITTGGNNTSIGFGAGGFISGGSVNNITGSNSIFIGYNTFPLADAQTNQVVIGYAVTGLGSNTTVLGNSSTVTTAIYGNLLLGTTAITGANLTTASSVTAASTIARGVYFNNTLIAAANSDVLVGLDINPTFTNGAFTGVQNYGLRSQARVLINPTIATTNSLLKITDNTNGTAWMGWSATAATGFFIGSNNALTLGRVTADNSNPTTTNGFITLNSVSENILLSTGVANKGIVFTDQNNATIRMNFPSSGEAAITTITTHNFSIGTAASTSAAVTNTMKFFGSSNNVGINTTTDAGFKLDVNGTARVSGAATFSSTLTANSISLTGAANIQNTTTGGYLALFGNTGGVYLGAHNGVGYQNYLVINASTGAVTLTGALSGTSASFSSSLIANTYVEIVGDLRFNSSAAERKIYFRGSGIGPDTNWSMGTYVTPTGATVVTAAATVIDVYGGATGYGFMVRNTSNVPLLQIAGNTGAATFSSSVTATSHNGTTQNIFSVDGTERMRLFSTGNLALNTTTDSGYKLDVNGTARVSGNLTAVTGTWDTFGIAVNNIRRNLETTLTINSSGVAANSLQFTSTTGWSSITSGTVNGMINSMSLNGSGTVSFANFAFTGIHSSTSSGSLTIININNSITTTNASSIVRGLYYNPSLISVAGSHRAFENTTGNVLLGTTSGSVGIGVNTSINASAILDITSTTKGVLFPRMTTTQKNAIATPATGLVVYDTTTNAQNYYDGTAWVALALTSSLSGYVPTSRSLTINGTAFDLSADRTWSVGTVTGSGTTNFISKFTGSTALGNSLIYDNGTSVGIGTTSATAKLEVISSSDGLFVTTSNSSQTLRLSSATNNNTLFRINNFNNNFYDIQNQPSDNSLVIDYNDTERLRITSEGGVNINSSTTGYTLNAIRSASTQFNDEFRGTGGLIQIFARFMQDESTKKGIAIGYNTTYSYSGIFGTQDTSSLRLGILVGSSFKAKIAMNTTTVSMDLPTSASGLNAGDLYNDSGTVKIV